MRGKDKRTDRTRQGKGKLTLALAQPNAMPLKAREESHRPDPVYESVTWQGSGQGRKSSHEHLQSVKNGNASKASKAADSKQSGGIGRKQTMCEAASRPCAWTAGPGPPEASQRRPLSSNRLELNLFSTHLYYLENLRESCVLRLRREIEESDFCDEAARDGLTGRSHGSYEIGATPHIITVNRAKAFLEAGQDESVEQGVLKADVYRWRRAAKRRKYRRSKNPKRETTGIQPQKWK